MCTPVIYFFGGSLLVRLVAYAVWAQPPGQIFTVTTTTPANGINLSDLASPPAYLIYHPNTSPARLAQMNHVIKRKD
jgi:hypothetical protein